ncbi:MAG: AAA family ATPase [Bacteroidaceae bacterium]|nr:AAA family ATPase [Bacteroidaceae bacterium]
MAHLTEGFEFEDFKVVMTLKQSDLCETYRVQDKEGKSLFMKLFNTDKFPAEQVNAEGKPMEIEICGKLQSSHIVKKVSDGSLEIENKRWHYLLTDYFSGQMLSDMVASKPLTWAKAKKVINDIIGGIEDLNALDLIHNDINPSNIMMSSSDENADARIIDLGHVAKAGAKIHTADLSPFYRAMETFEGNFSEKSDVYALAATIYTITTGETPWFFPYADMSDPEIGRTLKVKRQLVRLNFEKADSEMPDEVKSLILDILMTQSEETRKKLSVLKAVVNGQPLPKEDPIASLRPEPTEQKKATESSDMTVSVEAEVRKGNGFKDVAGMEELKDVVRKKIIFVLKNRELAERYKLTPPNGMLLYGPPGCGKTFFAEKFAEESGFRFIDVKASDVASPYIHGTQGKVADLFKKAEEQPPTVICFDEFDAFVPNRSGVDNQSLSSEVNEFLSQLNNCSKRGIFIVCTSNRPDKIDPAVLRTGRIDQLIYVPAPDKVARREMFRVNLDGRPCLDIDYDRLADLTEHYVASDISYLVNDAAITAALSDTPISQEILERCISCMKPSVSDEVLKSYERLREKMEGINHTERPHIGFT